MIVLDAPLNVRFVTVFVFHAAPVPEHVMFDVPSVSERVVLPELANNPIFQVWLLVSREPAVRVTVAVAPVVRVLLVNHEPPAPLNVTLPSVFPPQSTVCCVAEVETKEIADVVAFPSVYVIPDTNLSAMLPRPAVPSPMVNVTPALCVTVPVYVEKSADRQTAPELIVILPAVAGI